MRICHETVVEIAAPPSRAQPRAGSALLSHRPSVGHISDCRMLPVIARLLVLYLCLVDRFLRILYLGGN
jgi:hypothetical protein